MITIDVRGLPRSMTEDALQGMFSHHGKVHDLRLAKDLFSGECRGFAVLKMEGHEGREAIAALNGSVQGASILRVSLHSSRKNPRR